MEIYIGAVEQTAETWGFIKENVPDYKQTAGRLLFQNIFELAPAALSMYGFGRGVNVDNGVIPDEVYESRAFKSHSEAVVSTLEKAIGLMLSEDEEGLSDLGMALQVLGGKHVGYGVLPAHYGIVQTALLRTLEAALGPEKWTDDIRKGWSAVILFLAKGMMAGAGTKLKIVRTLGGLADTNKPTTDDSLLEEEREETTLHLLIVHEPIGEEEETEVVEEEEVAKNTFESQAVNDMFEHLLTKMKTLMYSATEEEWDNAWNRVQQELVQNKTEPPAPQSSEDRWSSDASTIGTSMTMRNTSVTPPDTNEDNVSVASSVYRDAKSVSSCRSCDNAPKAPRRSCQWASSELLLQHQQLLQSSGECSLEDMDTRSHDTDSRSPVYDSRAPVHPRRSQMHPPNPEDSFVSFANDNSNDNSTDGRSIPSHYLQQQQAHNQAVLTHITKLQQQLTDLHTQHEASIAGVRSFVAAQVSVLNLSVQQVAAQKQPELTTSTYYPDSDSHTDTEEEEELYPYDTRKPKIHSSEGVDLSAIGFDDAASRVSASTEC